MSKKVILNVATGHYVQYQQRLLTSLRNVGYTDPVKAWTNEFPPESPTHQQAPYCFKLFAIKDAISKGYETILWCDSGVWFTKHPGPIFERIEKEGHFFIIGGDKLFNWTSDFALDVFGETRDSVQQKDWQLIGGTVYGFDMTNSTTRRFWDEWVRHYGIGTFSGAYINSHSSLTGEENERLRSRRGSVGNPSEKTIGKVSDDPRCWGHRIDETVGSFLAYKLGMKLTNLGDLFQGYQRDDNTNAVARSGYTTES